MAADCQSCRAEVRNGARFCWRCGAALDRAPGEAAAVPLQCGACSSPLALGASVCAVCEKPLSATTLDGGLVGAVAPMRTQAGAGVEAASARKTTSVGLAGAGLRPGGSMLFTADGDRLQMGRSEPLRDPLPFLRQRIEHADSDAGRADMRDRPAAVEPSADPLAAGQHPRHPSEASGGADVIAAAGYRAASTSRRHPVRWAAAALVVILAWAGGRYWLSSPGNSLPNEAIPSTALHSAANAPEASATPAAQAPALSQDDPSSRPDSTTAPAAPATPVPAGGPAHASTPTEGAPTKALAAHPASGGSTDRRKRPARAAALKKEEAPRPADEVVLTREATPEPLREPATPAPIVAPTPCQGLQGLRLQQCLSCGGLGALRKLYCELSVQTKYCRGEGVNTPDCPIEYERVGN
jgi:Double zinc ribbon